MGVGGWRGVGGVLETSIGVTIGCEVGIVDCSDVTGNSAEVGIGSADGAATVGSISFGSSMTGFASSATGFTSSITCSVVAVGLIGGSMSIGWKLFLVLNLRQF
jgi:hypothetical protein